MWEGYEDVVISVGGANSSLVEGEDGLFWFLFFFFSLSRLRYLGAQRIFAAFRDLFVCPAWRFCASPPSSAMLWLAVWILTWPVCFLLPLRSPLTLPFISPPFFFCAFAQIIFFFFFFCMCTYSWDTWLVGVVQRNQPVYICSCGVFYISFF